MPAERSSMILLMAIAGLILLLLLGCFFWIRRTDTAPKAPLHPVALQESRSGPVLAGILKRQESWIENDSA
jgi:hypothetical protein